MNKPALNRRYTGCTVTKVQPVYQWWRNQRLPITGFCSLSQIQRECGDLSSQNQWWTIQRDSEIYEQRHEDQTIRSHNSPWSWAARKNVRSTWRRPNAWNKFKIWQFFDILGVCEKLLTKSKSFEIRKVLSESMFMWKIFKINFRSLHHFDTWRKCLVNSCQMIGRPFVDVWWRFGPNFFPTNSRVVAIDCHVQLAQV